MIKIQNGKFYQQQNEHINPVHGNMMDYFESCVRSRKRKTPVAVGHTPIQRRVLTETTNFTPDILDVMIESEKKECIRKKDFSTPRNMERDNLQRVLQSKINMTGSKKVAKHIMSNYIEPSPKKEDGQKEIFQNLRDCFNFLPQQNLVQDKKIISNLKRRDEEERRNKSIQLPSISQQNHYTEVNQQSILNNNNNNNFSYGQISLLIPNNLSEKKSTFKGSRRSFLSKKFEDRPLQLNLEMRKYTQQRINENDMLSKKVYTQQHSSNYSQINTDMDSIQLDSINIMNSSSFKNMDYNEVQKQAIIHQAEKQQLKESKRLTNQNRGYERLNFASKKQKGHISPKEPFIGLIFQDYENYAPIHTNCSRRSPITELEQSHSIDISQSFVDSNQQHTNSYKRQKTKKINHSFF